MSGAISAAFAATATEATAAAATDAFVLTGEGLAASTAAETAFVAAPLSAGIGGMQALSLGASLLSAGSQLASGKAAANSAKYNAEIAGNNQILAQQNAAFASAEGNVNVAAEEQKNRAQVGGILANQGASGVDVNSASNLDVRSSAQQTGELNAINIRAQAARQAYGYQVEGQNASIQQQLDRATAANAPIGADIGAGGTLLSAASNPSNPFGQWIASTGLGS